MRVRNYTFSIRPHPSVLLNPGMGMVHFLHGDHEVHQLQLTDDQWSGFIDDCTILGLLISDVRKHEIE